MTEVLFYHLEHQPLERVLPSLVERIGFGNLGIAAWQHHGVFPVDD